MYVEGPMKNINLKSQAKPNHVITKAKFLDNTPHPPKQ
jgi:hypothetical protein